MTQIRKLTIRGFRSIESLEAFQPQRVNILIGPNGSGKTNFISFFTFLSWMVNSSGKLAEYVAYQGGAGDLLFDGPDMTRTLEAQLEIETGRGVNEYHFSLMFAKPDRLVFHEEKYRFSDSSRNTKAEWAYCPVGGEEAQFPYTDNKTAVTIRRFLQQFRIFQFHNTSDTAQMRGRWSEMDGRYLKDNGQNLGSFLYYLQQQYPEYYRRVRRFLQSALPFWDDFELYPEFGQILLRWKEKGSHRVFHAGQASDGMLRIMCLFGLLGQPPENLPSVIFLDEPELGLHPRALDALAGLIREASELSQIFVCTHSVSLIDHFEPGEIIVVDRNRRASSFRQLDAGELAAWLSDYSISELWEKNVLGGRP